MTTTIDIRDLPGRLDEALQLAASGQEIVLVDGSTPRAKIVPMAAEKTRIAGLHRGSVTIADDFDDPLPEEFWLGTP